MLIFRCKKYNILLHFFSDHFQVGIIMDDDSIAKVKEYSRTIAEAQFRREEGYIKG
jgi:hypothetical protein